jgi:hypothetical protein
LQAGDGGAGPRDGLSLGRGHRGAPMLQAGARRMSLRQALAHEGIAPDPRSLSDVRLLR